MCGIVGYIGKDKCIPKIIYGLESLEYRGYDSAGIAYKKGKKNIIEKEQGKNRSDNKKYFCNNRSTGCSLYFNYGVVFPVYPQNG